MSHCNICWFKWFWGCKKWQFQCQNLKSKTSFINQISPLNLGKITLETLFSKSGFCPIGQNLIFRLSFERVNRRYFSNQFLGTSKLFWGVGNYFDGKSMPKCSKPRYPKVVWVTFGFDTTPRIEIVTVWRKRLREVFQVFDKDKLQNVGKLCLVHRLNFKITYWGGFGYHAIQLYCMRGKKPKMLQCDIYACPIFGVQISRWCDQKEEKYNISSVSHLTLQQKIWHGESI